ncbi:MAG: hypothetical protein JRE27_09240, partial [Deltaproteobacteria bacterium]|nr:hypothetical protein [Deltaproteobacteria bacterium]
MLKKNLFVAALIVPFMLLATGALFLSPCFAGESGQALKYTELFASIYDSDFIDRSTGWICGKGGIMYRTNDGGITWQEQQTHTYESLYGISFVDKDTGWAVGQMGTIVSTRDGGETWTMQKSPLENHMLCVEFVDRNYGIAAGDWGKIILTE